MIEVETTARCAAEAMGSAWGAAIVLMVFGAFMLGVGSVEPDSPVAKVVIAAGVLFVLPLLFLLFRTVLLPFIN